MGEFMAYPWGRVSFQVLVSTLTKKDGISFSQNFVALKGYVNAIQLVMICALPNLKEEVIQNEPVTMVDSESKYDTTLKEEERNGESVSREVQFYSQIHGHTKSRQKPWR